MNPEGDRQELNESLHHIDCAGLKYVTKTFARVRISFNGILQEGASFNMSALKAELEKKMEEAKSGSAN